MSDANPEVEAARIKVMESEIALNEANTYLRRQEGFQEYVEAERDRRALAEVRYSDSATGQFYFRWGVNGDTVAALRKYVGGMTRAFQAGDPLAPQGLTIVINSPGGSVFDGLDGMDVIAEAKDAGLHVTTKVTGIAASMGGILAQAGSDRVIGRHSWLHLHEVSTGSVGKASDLGDTAELAKTLTWQACDIYAARARQAVGDEAMSTQELFDWIERRERHVTPEESVKMGLMDRVG